MPYLPYDDYEHLNVEQALVDHVEVVLRVQKLLRMDQNPVIAVGGSYSKQSFSAVISAIVMACAMRCSYLCILITLCHAQCSLAFACAATTAYVHRKDQTHIVKPAFVFARFLHHIFKNMLVLTCNTVCLCMQTLATICQLLLILSGGALAAYIRIRFPDVIAGAVASSANLLGCNGLGVVSL